MSIVGDRAADTITTHPKPSLGSFAPDAKVKVAELAARRRAAVECIFTGADLGDASLRVWGGESGGGSGR